MNRQQQLVRREPESAAGFLLGEQQQQQQSSFSSRAAHCQTVAADLSLHSSTSSYPPPASSASYPTTSVSSSFPPSSEPPPLFYPLLPARTPLTHNLAGYDFFQHQQQGGPAEFSSEGLPPPAPQPFTDYQEYYDRLPYAYDETGLALAERPPYPDFSMKVEDAYHSFPAGNPPLLPPLHPSPAVLLHIKYVMESVCEAMFITDVTIVTATDTLRAHRSILSAHSPFLAFLLGEQESFEEEPVLLFPNHSSFVVRMLLQFFYTGEVATMTQRDIEPLRDICLHLGISALMARLEDVKLSISFQNLPVAKELSISSPKESFQNIPGTRELNLPGTRELNLTAGRELNISGPGDIALASPQQHPSEMQNDNNEEETKPPASCKFFHKAEKQKLRGPKSPTEDQPATRQYTVVSKMPKDTALQVNVKCPKCDLKFFKANLLEEHLKLHDGKKAKQCPVCQKSFNSNYHFKTHMRTHSHVKPFCCAVKDCRKEFVDSSSLRRHQAIHTGEKSFKCGKCGKAFTDRSSRKRHEYLHENPISITCSICSKKFTRKSQLRKHTAKFHPAAVFQEDSLKGSSKEDESKGALNECPECKAVFKRPSKLAQHMLVHSGVKPYQCDECEKTFARKTNLQLHKRTHTGEKPHACARCGRCFSDVSAFRRHCRTHTGERPYSCSLCGGAFTQASTLYNHKKTCKRKRVNSTDGDIEKLKNKCLLDI